MAEFVTPVGRIVQGVFFNGNKTNQMGQPLTDKMGNPREEFYLNLALPKNEQSTLDFYQQLQQVAQTEFPGGEWQQPDFNWKVIDGDTRNDKVGFAGHYVFKFKTSFKAPIYKNNGSGYVQLTSDQQIKVGDYVRIACTVNPNKERKGLYLNHNMIDHVGYGEAITSAPNPGDVFKQPATLPQGASSTPVSGSAPMPQAQPQAPMQQYAPAPPVAQAQPQPQAPAPPVAQAQPQPQAPGIPNHVIGSNIIDPNNI